MSRPRPTIEIEVRLSLRLNPTGAVCCYVTATEVRSDGQQAVLASRHFADEPLALLDTAHAFARELELEHFLPLIDPF